MKWKEAVHKVRIAAFFIGLVASILIWYSFVLMVNKPDDWSVNNMQCWGLLFSVLLNVIIWSRQVFVIGKTG
jgi:hypothetical protein